jgi:Icc-related predicted phosphoesterase
VRILAIADVHGAIEVYEWLVESAAKYGPDAVVLAGDLFSAGWEEEHRVQAQDIIIPCLKRISARVFYIMGNDDSVALDHEDEQIQPLHGRRLSHGTYSFVGYQYSPPFVGEAFVKPDAEIGKRQEGTISLLWKLAREPIPEDRAGGSLHPVRGTKGQWASRPADSA